MSIVNVSLYHRGSNKMRYIVPPQPSCSAHADGCSNSRMARASSITASYSVMTCSQKLKQKSQNVTNLVICSQNPISGPSSKMHYPVPNSGKEYPVFCRDRIKYHHFDLYLHLFISFSQHSRTILTWQSSPFDFRWHRCRRCFEVSLFILNMPDIRRP